MTTHFARLRALVPFLLPACHLAPDDPPKADAGARDAPTSDASGISDGASGDAGQDGQAGVSVGCCIAGQMRCKELPQATPDERANLGVECSSTSGMLTSPAKCPMDGFLGKCTVGMGASTEVRRFYAGQDAAYQKDFCATTARGVWSTTF